MTEANKINKIGNDIYQSISGLPFEKGIAILTTNMIGLLMIGIKEGAWSKDDAVDIVKRLGNNIESLLDNKLMEFDFEVNQ